MGSFCSGIHIDNDNDKNGIVLTVAHCCDPKFENIIYLNEDQNIKIINKINNGSINNKNIYEDIGLLFINSTRDTSKVFFLDNVDELPDQYKLKHWGRINVFQDVIIDESGEDVNNYITSQVASAELATKGIDKSNYKQHFRWITSNKEDFFQGGQSGGPYFIEFGEQNKKIAIVGILSGNNAMVNINDQMKWLNENKIKPKMAHYDTNTKTITEVE